MPVVQGLLVAGLHAIIICAAIYAAILVFQRGGDRKYAPLKNTSRAALAVLIAIGLSHAFDLIVLHITPAMSAGSDASRGFIKLSPEFHEYVWIATVIAAVLALVLLARSARKNLNPRPVLNTAPVLSTSFQDFAEISSEWLWETDENSRFIYISDRYYDFCGGADGSHLGRTRLSLSDETGTEAHWRTHLDDLENHRTFHDFQYSALSLEGLSSRFRVSGKPVFDVSGVFKGYRGVASEVSEITNTLAALKESEERFRHVFENAPVGMALITPEGNRFKVNQALADFLGYSLEDLSDTEMSSTNADAAALDESMRLRQRVVDGEISTYRNRRTYRHKLGHSVHGEVTGSLFRSKNGDPEYFIAHTVDITDQVNAEIALAESEARFRAFFDNAPLSLNVKDAEGRYIAVNKFYEAWTEQSEETMLGRTADQFIKNRADFIEYKTADEIVVKSGEVYEFEVKTTKPDGRKYERKVTKFPIFSQDGVLNSIGTIASDITDLKQNAALLQTLLDAAPYSISFRDPEGRFVFVNTRMTEEWGGTAERYIGKTTKEVFGEDKDLPISLLVAGVLKTKEPVIERETSSSNAPGATFLFNVIPVFHDEDEFYGVVVVGQNISALRAVETSLNESETRFRALIDSSPTAILIKDIEGRYIQANKFWHDWFNPKGLDIRGKTVFDLFPGDHAQAVHENDIQVVEKGLLITTEMETPLADDRIVTTLLQKFPIRGADGEVIAIGGINTDISDLKKTEAALQERERHLRTITDSLPVLITQFDAEQRFQFVNKTAQNWYRTPGEGLIGKPFADVIEEASYAKFQPYIKMVMAGETVTFEDQIRYPDGERRHVQVIYIPDFLTNGGVRGFFSLTVDQTERRAAEATSRQLFAAIDALSDAVMLFDSDDRLVFGNRQFRVINRSAPTVFVSGMSFEAQMDALLARGLFPEAVGREVEWKRERMERHRNPKGPFEILRQDGIWLRILEQRLPNGAYITLASDVTAQKAVEEQLRQSQKMEAVGQLTGGVAHDFNNLLSVIVGNLDFLAGELEEGSTLHTLAVRATNAAMRGADLNHRLLAFSRQQTLSPKNINLNDNISDMLGLLGRTLGAAIEIESKQAKDLWKTNADPAQVESALLNLAVNARDAMPRGGKLVIETANVVLDADYAETQIDVTAGAYVVLAVTDSGVGMTPDIQKRVFDPFFTTKEVGQGTGLGLSMVFGFAKQSGGHVALYSEVDHGATVKLYLPRAENTDEVETVKRPEATPAQGETILLVEDDVEFRALVTTMLKKLGYVYQVAENGETALAAMANSATFDLLISDIVLPGGMNGLDIAAKARALNPGIKVLFTSGYPRGALSDKNTLDDDVLLLEKPFRMADLARYIRDALGS